MHVSVGFFLALKVAPLLIRGLFEAWERSVRIVLLPSFEKQLKSRILGNVPQTECFLMCADRPRLEHILDRTRLFFLFERHFFFFLLSLEYEPFL